MLKCAVSVPKLAIAVQVSVRNITTTTASAVPHLAAAALSLAARWLQQWRKCLYSLFAGYRKEYSGQQVASIFNCNATPAFYFFNLNFRPKR